MFTQWWNHQSLLLKQSMTAIGLGIGINILNPLNWYNIHVKFKTSSPRSWLEEGEDITVILSSQIFVQAYIGSSYTWMGLSDPEGAWKWVDGTDYETNFKWVPLLSVLFLPFQLCSLRIWPTASSQPSLCSIWLSQLAVSFSLRNWKPGQPDNWQGHGLGGGEDCAHFHPDGKWNDDVCQRLYHWICEASTSKSR